MNRAGARAHELYGSGSMRGEGSVKERRAKRGAARPSARGGRVPAVVLVLAVAAACARTPVRFPAPADSAPALRRVVLMLDGVPHELMDSLWHAGHFSAFGEPSRLISTFPSLTGVAFRDIWGEAPTNGYEDRYYDRERDRVAGGFIDHVFNAEEHSGFHRNIDVKADGVTAGLAYIVPMTMARQELGRLRRSFATRMMEDSVIVAYIVSTDALAHRAPRDDQVTFLLEIDALIRDVRAAAGHDVEFVLFSDHGNDGVPTKFVRIGKTLNDGGFETGSHVRKANDVAVPTFGLVGSAFLYTWPGREAEVAAVVSRADGVDFVAFEQDGGINVWSAEGRARITSDSTGDWFRYQTERGDPLLLAPVLERLRSAGEADATGSAPDLAWLRETLDAPFVDPLRRITQGLHAVRNPADVVVSLEPGFHFGDAGADLLVGVIGTHGSLRTSSSIAFAMSTAGALPDPLRSDGLDGVVDLPHRDGHTSAKQTGGSH